MANKFKLFLERKGLSPRTIKEYMRYYGKVEEYVIDQEAIDTFLNKYNNPVFRAFLLNLKEFENKPKLKITKVTGRRKKRVPKTITFKELETMVDSMNSLRNKLMIAISYQGALRPSELLNIRIYDINWEKWKENKEENGELVVKGKGNKERIVYIWSGTMEYLYDYCEELAPKIYETDPIFKLSLRRWETIIKNISQKVLNKPITPHILRHSFATFLTQKHGMSIEEVSKYLGHSDISTTQIYIHVNPERIRQNINFISKEMESL